MTPQEAAQALRTLAQDLMRTVNEAAASRLKSEASRARQRIRSRTGRLARSVRVIVTAEGAELRAGGPQAPHAAAIQYGARRPPHAIAPRRAKTLAFVSAGQLRFAPVVQHPGGALPARPFLTVDERALEREADQAVQAAADRVLG